jgi:hypothetical protein
MEVNHLETNRGLIVPYPNVLPSDGKLYCFASYLQVPHDPTRGRFCKLQLTQMTLKEILLQYSN